MAHFKLLLFLVTCCVVFAIGVQAVLGVTNSHRHEIKNHQIKTSKNFLVLENLCMSNTDQWNFTIEYNSKNGLWVLFMIHDPGWSSTKMLHTLAFPDKMTCEDQMKSIADSLQEFASTNNIIEELGYPSLLTPIKHDDDKIIERYIRFHMTRSFRTSETFLWYMGVANCNSSEGLEFTYSQSITQVRENCLDSFGERPVVSHGEWTVPDVHGIQTPIFSANEGVLEFSRSGGWNLLPSEVIIMMLLSITGAAMKY